ncbi:MAG: CRISPR-associated protein Cas5 [Dehalococcoidia bacterium]
MMLRLRVRAPFAAFRAFTAGSYRSTAPFLTPSAAYGLILNIAGIESRRDDEKSPITLVAEGLPSIDIALGARTLPEVQVLYQQLHNYPVGETAKARAVDTKGNKYNIQPIRRELLSGLDASVCLRGNEGLEHRVREGLHQGVRFQSEGRPRYGLPFAGDNNLMVSHLNEEQDAQPVFWFTRVDRDVFPPPPNVCRLTVWVDRQVMTRTVNELYSRAEVAAADIPPGAWTRVPPEVSHE